MSAAIAALVLVGMLAGAPGESPAAWPQRQVWTTPGDAAAPAIAANRPQAPQVQPASAVDEWPELERLPAFEPQELAPTASPFSIDHFDIPGGSADAATRRKLSWRTLWQDQVNFYSWQSLGPSLVMFGGGAAVANTSLDQSFHDWWQRDVHTTQLNDLALDIKNLGEGKYMIPAALGLWLGGELLGEMPGAPAAARWGGRTTRSILVGFPMMLVMQKATGGARPDEGVPNPSHWRFMQDNNGVSGHSFMGAIPFLTAAQLVEDPWAKGALLAGSTLVCLSRIETDDHYLSQVMLGWWMAYIATAAVQRTALADSPYSVEPMLMSNGMGLAFGYRR